jgi:hypothetical protein
MSTLAARGAGDSARIGSVNTPNEVPKNVSRRPEGLQHQSLQNMDQISLRPNESLPKQLLT